MIEKLELYIKNNLNTETFVKFNKFKYGRENASCTVFMDEYEDAEKINRTYLDEEFDKKACSEQDINFFNNEKNSNTEFGKYSKSSKIDDFINDTKTENKFQKLLFDFIDKKNLKDSDVYNKVNIDRRLFSKIRSDQNYHPSKDTVILLGIALELNEKEMDELLNSAAYSLPKNNVYDLIIRFCFTEQIYNLIEINEFLEKYNCKLLGI